MRDWTYKEVWQDAYDRAKEAYPCETEGSWKKRADDVLADWQASLVDRARNRMKYGDE